MLYSVKNMLQALDENEIIYCHWKSNEHLSDALNGDTDLDILFDYAQRAKIDNVLTSCGLKRFRATPLMQYNAIEDFIGFDEETAKIWHVHAHYRMTLGEKHLKGYTITPWSNILLKDRVKGDEDVWVTNPSEELVLLFCRIALKLRWRDVFRTLSKDDITEILWLKQRVEKEALQQVIPRLVGLNSGKIIIKLFEDDLKSKSQFRLLQKTLCEEMRLFTSYGYLTSRIARTCREFFWLFGAIKRRVGWNNYTASRRVSPSGGLVVAIVGCDGAGKSTTLSYIKKEFSKKLDVVSIYLGSGDGSSSLLRAPMKIVARRVGGKGLGHTVDKEYTEGKRITLKSRLYSVAKIIWALALAHEKKSKLRKITKARNNGLLVITDRYPQCNTFGASDGPLLGKYKNDNWIMKHLADWEYNIYNSFTINPPDLIIKLMVPTDIAIARKPEMTVEEINRKKEIVMKLDVSDHTAVVNTSRPFDETRSEVMKEIWQLI